MKTHPLGCVSLTLVEMHCCFKAGIVVREKGDAQCGYKWYRIYFDIFCECGG